MKYIKSKHRVLFVLVSALLLSSGAFAQYGYHHYNNDRRSYRHFDYHPYVSVGIGYPRYSYRPVYRPYPVHRYNYSYVHYGPSFGLRLGILPFGYSTIFIGSVPYYYNQGIYYRNYPNGGYEVVAPPLGATVNHLPAGARLKVIDGQKYYELGGTFYQQEIADNNKVTYRVVGTDGVLNTDNPDKNPLPSDDFGTIPLPSDNNVNNNRNNNPSPSATLVDQLPADSKVVVLNKQKYYLSPDGVYYKEVIDGNNIRYEMQNNSSGQ